MKRNCVMLGLLSLAAAALLIGCNAGGATEAAPAEEVPVVAQATGKVVSEGVVEPARWTELRTESGGQVVEVAVKMGNVVAEGDLLVRLDPTDAELAVQGAEAALAVAQAQLARVKAGARPEEIAVAEAQLEAARATITQTMAQRERLVEGEARIDVAAAQAALAAAQAEEKQAYNLHEQTLKCFDFKLPDGSKETICPALGKPEEHSRYAWHASEDRLDAAQAQLTAAQNWAAAQLRDAKAAVQSAEARKDALQSRLELQKAGSSAERIAAAEAEVAEAQAALEAAKVALEKRSLYAPFDGAVAEVNVEAGDTVAPGEAPVAVVASLKHLWVRTRDLTELDVVDVAVGQPAIVTLDALPDREIKGHVARIDQQAEDYRGDVTYPVIVELDEDVPEMRWGMTALVEVGVE